MISPRFCTKPLVAAIAVTLAMAYGSAASAQTADAQPPPAQNAPADSASSSQSTSTTGASDKVSNADQAGRKQTAAEKQATELQTINVTGIAGSQERDIVLKRYADQIQDSITAQNIGQLPDINIADALQRVTGVQINRVAGQGTTVTVRGIAQVKSTLNGEEYFNAGGADQYNRPILGTGAADFEAVPSTLVSGIDVIKSSMASNVAGGISGIINLRTYRPFDFKKTYTLSGSAEEQYGDRSQKYNPTVSALFAYHNDRWGALLSGSYSRQSLANNSPNVGNAGMKATEQQAGWDFNGNGVIGNNTDATNFPRDYYYSWNNTQVGAGKSDRKRTSLHGSFQYKFTDSLTLTADADYSKYHKISALTSVNLATNNGTFVEPGATISPNGVLLNGTTGYANLGQTVTSDVSTSKAINTNLELNYDAGGFFSGNLRWVHAHTFRGLSEAAAGPTASLQGTVTLPDGTTEFGNPNGFPLVYANVNYTGKYPAYNFITNAGDINAWALNTTWGGANRTDVGSNIFRGDGTLHFDSGIVHSLQFGARYQKQDFEYNSYKYETAADDGCANPTGPGPKDQYYYFRSFGNGPCNGGLVFSRHPFSSLPAGYVTYLNSNPVGFNGAVGRGLPVINVNAMTNPLAFLNSIEPGETPFLDPQSSYMANEKIRSAYAQLNLGGELGFGVSGSTPWSANVGVRAVHTSINIGSYKINNSEYIGSGGSYNGVYISQGIQSTPSDYTIYLPSLNVAFDTTDDQKLRLAYSKNEARQNLQLLGQGLRSSYYVNGSPPRYVDQPSDLQIFSGASQGNPNLKPFESKNYNASYAWYFNPQSIVYLGAFLMQVQSFPQQVTVHVDFPDGDGVVRAGGPLNTYVNRGSTQIRGLEAEFRTQFTSLPGVLSGLGTQLNYTYANTGTTGLSHNSYNAIVFYQKDKLQARLAYNWRSKNFVTTNSSLGDPLNIYSKPVGYLDASIYYSINDNVSVYLQGSNLTDSYDDQYAQYKDAFYYQNISDRVYTAGVRLKF